MNFKNPNGITMLSIIIITIIIIVVLMTSILICTKFINTNSNNNNNTTTNTLTNNEFVTNSEPEIEKELIDSTDYEIAKLLFENYFENEFDESLITKASYNNEEEEFSCEYVSTTFNSHKKDYVEIRTNDFITYYYTSVENEYDEEADMDIPHSWNSTYEFISNEDKNKIIKLAESKNYYTSKNLSDDDYINILKIILKNDINDLQKIIKENNYLLDNYYLSSDTICYLFTQKNNKENYIKITSWISGVMGWNVYGSSNESIYEDSHYSEFSEEYIIDFDIKITENLEELEEIYNNLNK